VRVDHHLQIGFKAEAQGKLIAKVFKPGRQPVRIRSGLAASQTQDHPMSQLFLIVRRRIKFCRWGNTSLYTTNSLFPPLPLPSFPLFLCSLPLSWRHNPSSLEGSDSLSLKTNNVILLKLDEIPAAL